MKTLIFLVFFLLACLYIGHLSSTGKLGGLKKQDQPAAIGGFQCAGKTYCSQMTSCQEAQYYFNHCPGTKLDGDGDKIPCEKEWCGHSVSQANHF